MSVSTHSLMKTLAFTAAAALLVACGGGGSDGTKDKTGMLKLGITDAPVDDAYAVNVQFTGIELMPKAGEAFSIDFSAPKNIDLLAFQGADRTILLNEPVPAGEYEWMRLKVSADPNVGGDSYLQLTSGGQQCAIRIPSGDQTGLSTRWAPGRPGPDPLICATIRPESEWIQTCSGRSRSSNWSAMSSTAARRSGGVFRPGTLTLLGIGAIIGTGIFVLTGTAAANQAGPAITASYMLAGLACGFAALCYAEFASMIPIAGSAYTYSYASFGEFVAWILGWDLLLELALGSCSRRQGLVGIPARGAGAARHPVLPPQAVHCHGTAAWLRCGALRLCHLPPTRRWA